MKSDDSLLDACRRGDAAAWRAVLDRYERLVYSIPLNFGLARIDAEDVVQSTFAALLRGLDSITDEERLGAWLATVARRQTWRLVERRRREPADDRPIGTEVDPAITEDAVVGRVENIEWLHQGLALLNDRCRDLLIALYFAGEDPAYADVSARLGIPVGSIGPTRARCMDKLREHLDALREP